MRPMVYTPREVSKILGVSYITVTRWCRAGRIRALKLGHQWRISEEEVDRIISEGVPQEEQNDEGGERVAAARP